MFTPRFLTNCKFNVKLTTVIVLLVLLQTNSFALNGKIKKKLKEMSTIVDETEE